MACIFCSIVRGEIPCRKIAEDDKTLAFLDIAGDVDGHIVVIPKAHTHDLISCDAETLNAVLCMVQRVSAHLVSCGYEGVNLLHASGEAAGQSVPHLHFHLIPRKTGDGIDAWPSFPGAQHSLEEMHARLQMAINK